MRILLIEDDDTLRDSLQRNLSGSGYIVDVADNGENGSYVARTNKYHLIILDSLMPYKNGIEVCKEIRTAGITCPILALSVLDSPDQKVQFLNAGADDYLVKPFAFAELVARIQSLTRRPYQIQESILTLDDLTVDTNLQRVEREGLEVYLTKKEYLLLECMARKPGKVVSRAEILEDVWNNDSDPFSNTIEAHVRNLRRKIEKGPRKYIHTVPGRGYKLDRAK
ncbi:MAG TPA: response regulator transcription factor [Candidatus Paceibacterota bacterium]